jgi:hypothetical protein
MTIANIFTLALLDRYFGTEAKTQLERRGAIFEFLFTVHSKIGSSATVLHLKLWKHSRKRINDFNPQLYAFNLHLLDSADQCDALSRRPSNEAVAADGWRRR